MCAATQSHGSMWRKQTHTVCFHNLLEDHLRPSEWAGLQCNRDRKPGPRTKPRTETGLPPGRARFPHKVRLLWKYMTFDSGHRLCISCTRVCTTEALARSSAAAQNHKLPHFSRGPTRVDPAGRGSGRRSAATSKNQDVTEREGRGGCS